MSKLVKATRNVTNGMIKNATMKDGQIDMAAQVYTAGLRDGEYNVPSEVIAKECMWIGNVIGTKQGLVTGVALTLLGVWGYSKIKKQTTKNNEEQVNETTEGSSES